jgi:arsenate reductase
MTVPYNVLFLCTANSARSIIAESLLNALGGGRFRGHSAGSHPSGRVNPLALEVLERNGYGTGGARSKSWDEFTRPGAPRIDFVITLCDSAAAETCPVFFGAPVSAHWSTPDPAAALGTPEQQGAAFVAAMVTLRRRIQAFTGLPFDSVDARVMGRMVREIAADA